MEIAVCPHFVRFGRVSQTTSYRNDDLRIIERIDNLHDDDHHLFERSAMRADAGRSMVFGLRAPKRERSIP
jgi:hypothetical protein